MIQSIFPQSPAPPGPAPAAPGIQTLGHLMAALGVAASAAQEARKTPGRRRLDSSPVTAMGVLAQVVPDATWGAHASPVSDEVLEGGPPHPTGVWGLAHSGYVAGW